MGSNATDIRQSATTVVRGTAFHTPILGQIDVLTDYLFCFNDHGTLIALLPPDHPDYAQTVQRARAQQRYTALTDGQYLLPGFIDLHVHAPQWPQSGKALHVPLLNWLNDYTFPLEARYQDLSFAEQVYHQVVDTLLANGTTTSVYFATVHKEASLRLAEICLERGQRALVGKVVMDNDSCPDFYKDTDATSAVADTEWLIQAIQALPDNAATQLVRPIITPRFIPTCSDEVLYALGALAQKHQLHVQTHCSESDWAHQHVWQRMGKSDAQSLADFGLLTRRTLLAHANFLSPDDTALIQVHGSALAHCPVSNAYFANSVLPVAEHLRVGTNIGLATDISGGYSPSMFDAMRQSMISARMLEDGVNPELEATIRGRADSRIDFKHAFWLATTGGGQALDLPIGHFSIGQQWDAQIIDVHTPHSNICVYPDLDTATDLLQKIIYGAQRSNVHTVWVNGRIVHQPLN